MGLLLEVVRIRAREPLAFQQFALLVKTQDEIVILLNFELSTLDTVVTPDRPKDVALDELGVVAKLALIRGYPVRLAQPKQRLYSGDAPGAKGAGC